MISSSTQGGDSWSWEEAFAHLAAKYDSPFHAPATWAKHQQAFELLQSSCDSPAEITIATISQIARALESRGNDPISINSLLQTIRTQCGFFAAARQLELNPFLLGKFFLRARAPGQSDGQVRALTAVQMRKVLQQADDDWLTSVGEGRFRSARTRALLYMVALTAMRRDEALFLRWEEVDLDRQVVEITERSKRKKTIASCQPLPVPDLLKDVLLSWRNWNPNGMFVFIRGNEDRAWDTTAPKSKPLDYIASVGRRAGVEGVTFPVLRRTLISYLELSLGVEAAILERWLRHSPREIRRHYQILDIDEFVRRFRHLNYS